MNVNFLNRFLPNLEWKPFIICFITAFTFWIFHSLNGEHTASITVPINIIHYSDNLVALAPPPDEVHVNVSGNGWTILSKSLDIMKEPIQVKINNPLEVRYLTGRTLLPLVDDFLKGTRVNYVLEDSIFFEYDSLIHKTMGLKVIPLHLEFEKGYRKVSDFRVEPDSVVIQGPSHFLDNVNEDLEVILDLAPINDNFDEMVQIEYPRYPYTSVDHHEVNVSFDISYFISKSNPVKLSWVNTKKKSSPPIVLDNLIIQHTVREDNEFLLANEDSIPAILDYSQINWTDSTLTPILPDSVNLSEAHFIPDKVYLLIDQKTSKK
ncbi:YbbR-like domain-containing protein [Sediminitomix flava]|uniref:YbbR-like protein n=1 Tax=Sediminitomix flava TaxID=379075 RepID=A0A315Z221_SEDFL|nr:hypothetical protein [Sediminitomix flava]PWJ36100.1 hypothetical protein BC781_109116 [Sediminitomix flava]